MKRLGHGNQIDTSISEWRRFRGGDTVAYVLARGGILDLSGAGIGGDNFLKVRRQSQSRLAAPRTTIPRATRRPNQAYQMLEQRLGIGGAKSGVRLGVS